MKKWIMVIAGLGVMAASAVEVGEKAPPIVAKDQDGNAWELSGKLGGKHLVVYFYPAAMTGGCTKQACAYRDHIEKGNATINVVGISGDTPQNLKWFQTAEQLNFTLLSDPDGAIAKAYGVAVQTGEKAIQRTVDGKEVELKRSATAARWTFIIDPQGTVVYKDDKAKPIADLEKVLAFLSKPE
ncbi:peroxiredoxin [Pontiella sp.]|uniref:peroxiredoxin n=1 Tax=Pontiella sp. TaxID=2837462 RepID=UPI0035652B99